MPEQYKYLCANGHAILKEHLPEHNNCPVCEASVVVLTNHQAENLEEIEPAIGAVCPHCSVHSFTQPPRYRIPT